MERAGTGRIAPNRSGPAGPRTPPRPESRAPLYNGECGERSSLRTLSPAAIWKFLKHQPPSYWLVAIYLFFEYVRPQQIYEPLQGPPYARIVIILGLVALLFERRTLLFRAPELLLALFSGVVIVSSVAAFEPAASYEKLSVYCSWVLIYVLIANAVNTEERFFVFVLSFLLYSSKMSQFGTRSWGQDGFVYRRWGTTGAPGWFQNSGEFGIQMCMFLPLIVCFIIALRKNWPHWLQWVAWGVAGTAITGIVASSSRGAVVGLGAVALWAIMNSRRKIRGLVAAVVLAAGVYTIIPAASKDRFQQAGEDKTSVARTTMWKQGLDMMRDHPILGIGYANWLSYRSVYYSNSGQLAHNTFIEAGSELGFTGLAAFLGLIACTFVLNRRTRKLAAAKSDRGRFIYFMALGLDGSLVGFIASGFFISVLYYPFFWINFAMTAALYNVALTSMSPETFSVEPRSIDRVRGRVRDAIRSSS